MQVSPTLLIISAILLFVYLIRIGFVIDDLKKRIERIEDTFFKQSSKD